MKLVWTIALALMATGCATGETIKRHIAGDLRLIANMQDCPTTCALLKAYIKTKLGAL